ncbi:MAG: mandelate racemase/muconate lactonizing enzyme family protein [Actinobacteria bacterium]|nr:mandelate racemase/muconate lactonizing enzyme family protein [Actinomycetota bacterium]
MRIERVELFPLRLRLKQPFETGQGAVSERDVAVLRLTDSDGFIGLGEITPYPRPRFSGLNDLLEVTELQARPRLEGCDIATSATALDEIGARLPAPALAAVDTALLDLQARRMGVPLAQLFERPARRSVPVNATLAAADPATLAAQAAAFVSLGFKTLKLKVGLDDDLARAEAVRDAVGWSIALRLDANGSWFSAEAVNQLSALTQLGVELIEQPVRADDLIGMHRVRESVTIPVVADEGVRDAADLRNYVRGGACDGVAVKLSQVGGPSRAHLLVDQAEAAGLFCFVTSTLDGPVGLAAGLHFACARPEIEIACGLATGLIFEGEPYARGLPDPVDGALTFADAPGLGIELDESRMAELAIDRG